MISNIEQCCLFMSQTVTKCKTTTLFALAKYDCSARSCGEPLTSVVACVALTLWTSGRCRALVGVADCFQKCVGIFKLHTVDDDPWGAEF